MKSIIEAGFILAGLSALCWSSVDIARKQLVQKMRATTALVGLMLGQVFFLLPLLAITELGGKPDIDHTAIELFFFEIPELSGTYFLYAGATITLNLAANLLFLHAVTISPLSLTTPYLALTPVFSAILAYLLLGQVVAGWGIVGILVVCLGAFFLNPGSKDDGMLAPLKALWSERGSLYMVIVSLVWSITPILDREASSRTGAVWHTGFLAFGIGTALALILTFRGKARETIEDFKNAPVFVLVCAFLLLGAMALQLASYDYVAIAYVETFKRALGVIGAMAAGMVFFGEKDIGRRFIGAAVMVVGVAMVLFSGG